MHSSSEKAKKDYSTNTKNEPDPTMKTCIKAQRRLRTQQDARQNQKHKRNEKQKSEHPSSCHAWVLCWRTTDDWTSLGTLRGHWEKLKSKHGHTQVVHQHKSIL